MRDTILERGPEIRRRILQVTIVLAPLLVVRTLNDAISVPKLAIVMLAVALVAAIRLIETVQGSSWRESLSFLIPAGVILLPLLVSWIFAPYKTWSLFGEYPRFQGIVPYAVIVVFGFLVADAFRGKPSSLAAPVTIVGGLIGTLAVLQRFNLDPFPAYTLSPISGAVTTLGNPNFTGGFLAVAFPIAVALALDTYRHHKWFVAAAAAVAAGIVASNSQGAWIAAIAGAALFVGYLGLQKRSWALRAGAIASAGVVVMAIFISMAAQVSPSIGQKAPLTATTRGWWWTAAVRMGADHPITGGGPNSFGYAGIQYRLEDEAEFSNFEFPDDPHSVPLSFLANGGILGVAGVMALGVWVIYQRPKWQDNLWIGFFCASIAYFAQAIFSIDEVGLRMLAWTVLGGLASTAIEPQEKKVTTTNRIEKSKKRLQRRPSRPLRAPVGVVALAVVPILGAAWVSGFVSADKAAADGSRLMSIGATDDALARFDDAHGFREEYAYRRLHGMAAARIIPEVAQDPARLIQEVHAAFSFVPEFPDFVATLNYAEALNGLSQIEPSLAPRAVDLYEAAIRLDPLNPVLRERVSQTLVSDERFEEVLELIAPYMDEEDPAPVIGSVALAYAESGDSEKATELAQIALGKNPEEESALRALEAVK